MKQKMQLCCHIVPSHTTLYIPSRIFFFNLIIAFQKTHITTRKDTEAGNGTTRGKERLPYEETLNRLYGSTDYREFYHICFNLSKHEYIGSSKQNDYSLSLMTKEQVGDLELSRDQLAGTWMKRYHPQLLNIAVEVHPALSDLKQQTARSDLVRSLPLSLQAFLMLFPGPC